MSDGRCLKFGWQAPHTVAEVGLRPVLRALDVRHRILTTGLQRFHESVG